MSDFSQKNIQVVSEGSADGAYSAIESEKQHTPYETEVIFYRCIEMGDVEGTRKMLLELWNQNIVVGRMSHNNLKQMQYFAVCCITLGIRAAIRGGVSEISAYRLSDEYIQKIDNMKEGDEVPDFLSAKAVELAELVARCNRKKMLHPVVKKAAHYIEKNLYQKITPTQVAEYCNVSKDHLSLLFKQNMGETAAKYILREKLSESRRLINRGLSNSQIAYQLGFCSESHFIAKYKECYGNTPGEERKSLSLF
jgi:AraC-like DNA-binding protein